MSERRQRATSQRRGPGITTQPCLSQSTFLAGLVLFASATGWLSAEPAGPRAELAPGLAAAQGAEVVSAARGTVTGENTPWVIDLGAARVELAEGQHAPIKGSRGPFLVQFTTIPNQSMVDSLRERGVTLDSYAGAHAYIARSQGGFAKEIFEGTAVRATAQLSPAMKLSEAFVADPDLRRRVQAGNKLRLVVVFAPGTDWESARAALALAGIDTRAQQLAMGRSAEAEASWEQLLQLLDDPLVLHVDPALPPLAPANADASWRVMADAVQEDPEMLGVDGSGVRVGVLDWFPSDIHADFGDRVTVVADDPRELFHGQMVSGAIAGAGTLDARAKGIAPGADLYWHGISDKLQVWNDTLRLVRDHDVTIASNSWSIFPGWQDAGSPTWNGNLWVWGYYHELAAGADELARSQDVLIVIASGNHRRHSHLGPHQHGEPILGSSDPTLFECVHPPNSFYESIAGPANAKNVLTLGAVSKDEVSAYFSSSGPTEDGRLKPDLVAPGVELFTTYLDDGYARGSGTSMATPVASGAAALVTDLFERRHGRRPQAITLKNLLIHSARDLGDPGPDYIYGHGLIDAELACRVVVAASFSADSGGVRKPGGRRSKALGNPAIGEGNVKSWILSGEISHGERFSYFLQLDGLQDDAGELRATLAWHDPPGQVLVNDLDLWLRDPTGARHEPFTLDPDHPERAAEQGRNAVDNVEHMAYPLPHAGQWAVVVEGEQIAMGPQEFSLIVSATDGNRPLERRAEGSCRVLDLFLTNQPSNAPDPESVTVFRTGDFVNFVATVELSENGDYGSFFGLFEVTFGIVNQDGELVVQGAMATHSVPMLPVAVLNGDDTITVPAEMAHGRYTAHLVVSLGNGTSARAEVPFEIE
jgi:subtilisin family serine protease